MWVIPHDTASAILTDSEIKNENSARAKGNERKMKGVKGKCGTCGMLLQVGIF
jgi:hypothetical protein